MLVHSWWMLVIRFWTIEINKCAYFHFSTFPDKELFHVIPIYSHFSQSHLECLGFLVWSLTTWVRWVRYGGTCSCTPVFFVRLLNGLGQLTRPMKLPSRVAFLIFNAKLGIFRFSTSLAFRCEAALESQGSSSRQRIEGLEKTLQVRRTNVCQFKWIQVVLQESHRFFARNSKQGDEGSINQTYALAGIS